MKIYISGPISGQPTQQVANHFNNAEKRLKKLGYKVVNTLDNPPLNIPQTPEQQWSEYMKSDIIQLMHSDAIYMLEGYGNSKGASLEYTIAERLEMPIIYEHNSDREIINFISPLL